MAGRPVSTSAPTTPTICWYGTADHRPTMAVCPVECDSSPMHAERQGDGLLRRYCEAHAYWRAHDVGRRHVRPLRADELT